MINSVNTKIKKSTQIFHCVYFHRKLLHHEFMCGYDYRQFQLREETDRSRVSLLDRLAENLGAVSGYVEYASAILPAHKPTKIKVLLLEKTNIRSGHNQF